MSEQNACPPDINERIVDFCFGDMTGSQVIELLSHTAYCPKCKPKILEVRKALHRLAEENQTESTSTESK